MAVVKTVCGDCGAELSPGDAYCPRCGARIEAAGPRTGATTVEVRCEVCGHTNNSGSRLCESCGAKLPGTGGPVPSTKRVERSQPGSLRKQSRVPGAARKLKMEPWQIVSVVAVVALIAYLVYFYSQRSAEPSRQISQSSQAPPMMEGLPGVPDIAPFEKAVEAHPNDFKALLQLANVLHDNRAFGRAIEAYKKYLAQFPKDPDARVDLGICYFQLGQADSTQTGRFFALALQEMEAAYKANPTHQPAAFNIGIVNLNTGNLEESNKWFKRTVELNKNSDLGVRAQRILEQHSIIQ